MSKKSSYLINLPHQFGRYMYMRLLVGAALAGDMFKCKTDEIFRVLNNVFGITDNILIVDYDADGR